MIGPPDVVIGAAGPTDIEYPFGGSICRLVNLGSPRHGLRCAEVASAGSAANIDALRSGRVDIAVVPSDVLSEAAAGEASNALLTPAVELRVLFAGQAELFTLVAHQELQIHTVADLRGKRVGIGSRGSRQRVSMERVMTALGLSPNDFTDLRESSPAEQNRAFCADELDAIVYAVSHPDGLIRHATLTCHGMLVPVGGPAIEQMLSEHREYTHASIPGGTYPANPADVHTFGVRAVAVASERMSDTVAYEIVKAVFDNYEDFRRLHPAFESLTVEEMIRVAGRPPIHTGAARYYRERGWLP